MMQRPPTLEPLVAERGVESGGEIVVRGLRADNWGRVIVLDCVYQRGEVALAFRWTFADCREIKWRVYVHAEGVREARLGDVKLGRDAHRSPALLLADTLGLSLVYGGMIVEKLEAF